MRAPPDAGALPDAEALPDARPPGMGAPPDAESSPDTEAPPTAKPSLGAEVRSPFDMGPDPLSVPHGMRRSCMRFAAI